MLRHQIMQKIKLIHRNIKFVRLSSSDNSLNLEKLVQEGDSGLEVLDEDAAKREAEIEKKRNKSRLKVKDRNMLLEKNPTPEPIYPYHETLKYNRRLYGRYGASSGVDPALCWPTKQELEGKLEYERVAYPFTIQQMMETSHKQRQEKEEQIRVRQEDIVKKMEKLDDWINDLNNRIAKKAAEANAAKEHRERLVEEVRRHFGYTVDPRDDKFKEMLEKKEKEQKKAMKEARRKAKEDRLMAQILSKGKEDDTASSDKTK